MSGTTDETLKKYRQQLISATKEKLNSFAPMFEKALKPNNLCVIGNANKVDENSDLFKNVRNLTK